MKAWIREVNRQRTPAESDPNSWRDAEQDPWWREQRELRDRRARA